MISNTFFLKVKENRKVIFKTLAFFIFLRSIHGFSLLAIGYLLGIEINDIRNFEIFGFRVYFLIIALVALLVIRRFTRIYRWWKSRPDPITI
ncbi:MAG: hypothetical protein CL896_00765 [Dehalococcoidia bacterium]|nr:hypothetical protein [Dehalococcoidia bacterium]